MGTLWRVLVYVFMCFFGLAPAPGSQVHLTASHGGTSGGLDEEGVQDGSEVYANAARPDFVTSHREFGLHLRHLKTRSAGHRWGAH